MFLLMSRIILIIMYAFSIVMPVYIHGMNDHSTNFKNITREKKGHEDLQTTASFPTSDAVSSTRTRFELSSSFKRNGDVNIGGLFSIHNDGVCKSDIDPSGLQGMYAMVYMIDKINSDPDLLGNVTLGFNIHDYCGDVNIAVTSSMDFIQSAAHCSNKSEILNGSSGVKAVIGPMSSDAALSVASLFSLFKLPQVSSFATSTELSDERYSYFLRNVPSDNTQIIALADIVQYFGWSSVGVLSTDDLGYGIKGSELLVNELQARNICVAYQTRFNADYTDFDFEQIISHLRNLSNIKVLVSIADELSMLRLLDVFAQNEAYGYTWIASDGWAWSPMLAEDKYYKVVQGMLGVSVPSYTDLEFKDYLKELRPDGEDPFLTRYWEQTHNCYLSTCSNESYVSACIGNESFASDDPFLSEALVSSVMDSVKVIAYGLQACNSTEHEDHEDLLECMKNVSFVNEENDRIAFKKNGDLASPARYGITNIQPSRDCRPIFPPKLIGTWTENSGLDINESAIYWPGENCEKNDKELLNSMAPKSFCSADCDFGYRLLTIWENNCCWECIPCANTEYTNTTNALQCIKCNYDEMANSSKNGCNTLPHSYLTPRDNTVALIIAIVASIGIVVTFFLILFFVVKRRCTVVHFSCGKLFKFPLLVSIMLCFSFPSFLLSTITTFSCQFSATIQLLPIIICQIILLFITCVVHKRDSKNAQKYNAWIFLIIISLYTCFIAIGYIFNNPGLAKHPDYVNAVLIIGCSIKGTISCYTMATCCILLLDIIGITVAYRIRTTEGNFNEAKFIFFTFISHTMLWTAVVLVNILVGNDMHSKHLTISFGMICSAYIFLACVFFPKLNAYTRKPEARTLVQCTEPKRGWKFRRKMNTKAKENWSEEAILTKQAILSNIEKTIEAINDETMQAKYIISLCKGHQRELKLRLSRSESELLSKLHSLRNTKAQIMLSSKYRKTTKC